MSIESSPEINNISYETTVLRELFDETPVSSGNRKTDEVLDIVANSAIRYLQDLAIRRTAGPLLRKTYALTDKTESHSVPKGASNALKENIQFAAKIVRHIEKTIPFAGNKGNCGSGLYKCQATDCYNQLLINMIKSEPCPAKRTRYAELLKVGNCTEMTVEGFLFSNKEPSSPPARICFIEGGNHAFGVIGRDPKIKNIINDPNAVVFDGWTRSHYPASEIPKYLKDFQSENYNQETDCQYISVADIDLKTQRILECEDLQELMPNEDPNTAKQIESELKFLTLCENNKILEISKFLKENQVRPEILEAAVWVALRDQKIDVFKALINCKQTPKKTIIEQLKQIQARTKDPALEKTLECCTSQPCTLL